MTKLGRFQQDEAGAFSEKVAIASAVLGVTCVLAADAMSTMLQNGKLGERWSRAAMAAHGVDMSSTGSVPRPQLGAGPVSPCGGHRR